MSDSQIALEISDLDFSYGKNKVLNKFSLSLDKGEILGLIGKNGAGKTTTIHILLGLLRHRKGLIKVLGFDPRHDNIKVLDQCGFFPEQGDPYGWMRVKNLFKMGQYSYSNWDSSLCNKLSAQLELDVNKKICDLSRGMLVKAKLVFAMAHQPEILVLDEPTNGLDPLSRYDILSTIKSLSIQHNHTVLISSHNLDEIAEIATQICIIDKGNNLLAYSMDDIRTKFALVEFSSNITPTQDFSRQVIRTKKTNGNIRCLVKDKTNLDVINFLDQYNKKAELNTINLKELFIFMTRDLV